jgi:hypothetical protein
MDTPTRTKRRRLRWTSVTAAALVGVIFAIAGASYGDNLTSDAATTAGITTITAGDSTTITYRLVSNSAPSGDANGCDATPANPVNVTISKPAAVSGTSSIQFTGCGNGNTKTATFSSSTSGTYSITHSISGGVSGSLFNNQANFTLTVNPAAPTNTAPTLNLPADQTAEATWATGAAVSYTASADDAEDGGLTPTCSPASGSTFALGITQVNCSVTDGGGLTTSGMFNVTVVDTTAPSLSLPADKTAEASSAAGAAVNFTTSASDLVDGSVSVNCDASSGDTFPLGTTTVHCSATDAHSNTANGSFTITVQDTTAPSLTVPADITKEATSAAGAAVNFTTSASDAVDSTPTISCSDGSNAVHSGDTFPLGTTTVSCTASDDAGNESAAEAFTITVQDTTAPSLNLPADKTAEATSAAGAAVTFSVSANDAVDGPVSVNCDASSGDTFPLGMTTVHCSATDAHSNAANGSFTITVQDTTAPSLNLPSNITTTAASNSSKVVSYSASATDLVDGPVTVNCSPASGSSFGVGTTTVNCSATDAHGNTANGSFTVTVNYNWTGFFQPIDNGVLNIAKAGSTIPVKFSLGGDQGLNIWYSSAYPNSGSISCNADPSVDAIEEYSTATVSGLKYDATANQYIYNWKTTSSWSGTCRQLIVRLGDGTYHRADFKFTK